MNSNHYCIDSISKRNLGSQDPVLSPPLTPSQQPFDKRNSNDYSGQYNRPNNYSVDNYHHWMNHNNNNNNLHSQFQHQKLQSHHQNQSPSQSVYSTPIQQHSLLHNSVSPKQDKSRKQPTKQNKHVCTYPECLWSFKRYEHLKRHMLVHTGERPHVCLHPGCGKRFSRSDNFHAHYRTHEKKAFVNRQKNNNSTNNHLKKDYPYYPVKHEYHGYLSPPKKVVVSQEKKPHACTDCDKSFRRLEHLKRHVRIHTHEQPFKCNFPGCLKAFSRSDNLTQHKKTHERRGSTLKQDSFHSESFSLDFIRDNNEYYEKHSIMSWQNPGDTTTETVGC